MNLGHTIRKCREARGLTLEALSEQSGLSKSFLSQLENERREASLATIEAVSDALQVPMSLLVLLAAREGEELEVDERSLRSLQKKLERLINAR